MKLDNILAQNTLLNLGKWQSRLRYSKEEYLLQRYSSEKSPFTKINELGKIVIEMEGETTSQIKAELLWLLDANSTKLIQHIENYSDDPIKGSADANKVASALREIGLVSEVTPYKAQDKKLTYYEVTSSINQFVLDYWLKNRLYWSPSSGTEIRSGLLLGYSLPEILWYYNRPIIKRYNHKLTAESIGAEIRDYCAFAKGFVKSIKS